MQARLISIFILASSISLLSLPAAAQRRAHVTVAENDSTPLFNGVEASVDLVGLGEMMLGDYGQYEGAVRINLRDRYFPIVEIGLGKADANDETTQNHYKTSAPYFRIGCDFNLLKNKHDIYRVYGGARYGFTSYKYDLSNPSVNDPVWGGNVPYGADDVKCNCHWLEAAFGVSAKIWGPVHLGWSVRYRRRLFYDNGNLGNAWYVPGFGKEGGSRIGATFNVIIQL